MFHRTPTILGICSLLALAACGPPPGGESVAGPRGHDDRHWHEPASTNPIALCNAVQRSSEVPVTCTFDYVGDQPHMLLGVPNEEVLQAELDGMLEHLVLPFCSAQNEASQPSGVIFVVANSLAKQMDCRTRHITDWIELNPEVARTMTIEQACDQVSRGNYGVGCSLMDFRGIPAMVLNYGDGAQVAENVVGIAREIGTPFCQSANHARVSAAMVLWNSDDDRARIFDCATGQIGEEFRVRRVEQPSRRPVSPGRGGRSAPPASAGKTWALLPVDA